jgi:uracil-DNA glycosylase
MPDAATGGTRTRGALAAIAGAVVGCRLCPRLVAWRELVAKEKRAAFSDWEYWGRPVPGFVLRDVYIAAVNRCCPPGNRPTPEERDTCLPYLEREMGALGELRVVVPLGSFAWDGALRAVAARGHPVLRPRPRFGHGVETPVGPYRFVGAFHPSQQNTFTGKLTPGMLDEVLRRAVEVAGGSRG